MKQVKQRTLLIYILLLLFLAGLVAYCVRYVALGGRWASFRRRTGICCPNLSTRALSAWRRTNSATLP